MIPYILNISNISIKTKANESINASLKNYIQNNSLKSEDFYFLNYNNIGNEKVNSLSVNTILINDLCSQIAVDISKKLNNMDKEEIEIPLGTLSGIKLFSGHGPKYRATVHPMGNATVDYESSFISLGINQINFQIWLRVEIEIQVINPSTQHSNVFVERKVPLVNTVINSDVPFALHK